MSYSKFINTHLIKDGDLSADITSEEISTENIDKLNVHVAWTGTSPVGSLIFQGTVDKGTTWHDIGVTEPTITGASGAEFLIVDSADMCWTNMRVFWDFTSGVGTVQCWIHAKNI